MCATTGKVFFVHFALKASQNTPLAKLIFLNVYINVYMDGYPFPVPDVKPL